MLTAGDEFGRTQQGNNNAYAQDNETTWLDWEGRDRELEEYRRGLMAGARGDAVAARCDRLPVRRKAGRPPDVEWLTGRIGRR